MGEPSGEVPFIDRKCNFHNAGGITCIDLYHIRVLFPLELKYTCSHSARQHGIHIDRHPGGMHNAMIDIIATCIVWCKPTQI